MDGDGGVDAKIADYEATVSKYLKLVDSYKDDTVESRWGWVFGDNYIIWSPGCWWYNLAIKATCYQCFRWTSQGPNSRHNFEQLRKPMLNNTIIFSIFELRRNFLHHNKDIMLVTIRKAVNYYKNTLIDSCTVQLPINKCLNILDCCHYMCYCHSFVQVHFTPVFTSSAFYGIASTWGRVGAILKNAKLVKVGYLWLVSLISQ